MTHTSFAASEYDDFVEKITTKKMIHHIKNYYSHPECGSPTDDYAEKWLYAFKQKYSFYNQRDIDQHTEAVKSLERAMVSPNGAYLVFYIQKNNNNRSSQPGLATVYWTENDSDKFVFRFTKVGSHRLLYLSSTSATARLNMAVLGPGFTGGGSYEICNPENVSVRFNHTNQVAVEEGVHSKILVSSFRVIYPENYNGKQVPSDDPAKRWRPVGSPYDKLIPQVTTPTLVNYVMHAPFSCGSPNNDRVNLWLNDVMINTTIPKEYHNRYVSSLQRAIAHGDYAIYYTQYIQDPYRQFTSPNFASIFWSESKHHYGFAFYGEKRDKRMFVYKKVDSPSPLYEARIASPRFYNNIPFGGCQVEFIEGESQYNMPDMRLAPGNYEKIFKSTFDVRYPYGYKGPKMPGSPAKLDYLALGDSFSSGEGDTEKNGATNQKYYRQFTDVKEDKAKGIPKEKCHVSTRSYPYKLARYMGLSQSGTKQWDTVACSGATTYDMNWDNSGGYEGQNSPLGRLHGLNNKDILKGVALNEMIPGRVKQVEFVKKYQPKVITLTAGGNDVDFGGKIRSCIHPRVSLGTCDWAKNEMGTLGSQIRGQFNRLVDLYKELKTASPGSKIYAIGYPQFMTDAEPASCGLNAGAIDLDERRMIVRATQYMNEVIEAAARKAGVKYVDISNALNGGKICDKHQIYMTGIVGLGEQESYHPNRSGHTMIFAEIAKQLNHEDLSTYSKYPAAGDESVNAPSSIYFDKGIPSSVNTKILANARPAKGSNQKIALAQGSLQPNSSVRVEIRSNPVDLGSYNVSSDGSLQETITIPDNTPAGYHTLFIYGKSKDGEGIKITQTLLVTGKDQDDLDDNGIKDKNQPCGAFVPESNKDEDLDGIDDACDPEVAEPILYSARNGSSGLGEDENRIYLFRNTRASHLTGVTNDYVDKSKDKDNTDALVGYTASEETRGLAFEKLIIMKESDADNDIAKGMPIVLAKDVEQKCYALKPEDYLSPALKPGSSGYQQRGLIKLSNLPKGVSCEE